MRFLLFKIILKHFQFVLKVRYCMIEEKLKYCSYYRGDSNFNVFALVALAITH